MNDRLELGRRGESAAAEWYRSNGYQLLDRNWRIATGELDIVARRRQVIVFCEVKTRTSHAFGRGADAVGREKQRRVRALAVEWLAQSHDRYDTIRFDVADVDGAGNVAMIEGCF